MTAVRYPYNCFAVVFLFVCCLSVTHARDRSVTVGAMFDTADRDMQSALRDSIERFKLARWFREDTKLDWTNVHMSPGVSHQAASRLCTLLKAGVSVVIGPQTETSSTRVQAMCNKLQVPHIEMTEDFRMEKVDSSVNIAPHPLSLSKAYAALLNHWTWYDEFAVVYESVNDLYRIQDMLQFPSKKARLFQLEEEGDHRVLLKAIRDKGLTRIIMAVRIDLILPLFDMAEQVGITTEYYDYVIPNLDVHTINFEKFYNRTMNITGFSMIDTKNEEFHDILHHWRRTGPDAAPKVITAVEQGIKMEVALLYDAIYLYARAISEGDITPNRLDYPLPTCEFLDMDLRHPHNAIIDKLKSMEISGLTGPISFNEDGQRTDFTISVMKLFYVGEKGFRTIATYNENTGYHPTLTQKQLSEEADKSLQNITLRVTTIENPPFFMEIPENRRTPGGRMYEGYVVDLMDAVAAKANITYMIKPVADGSYGALKATGWNGMVGELMNKKADLCAADLTITQVRQDAVDFTIPFMHLGISILYKKSAKAETSLFSFLKPLSAEVWIYMITGYLGVSIVMFMLARISPYEWDNPHPCNDEPEELENQFSLLNCLWFAIGSLMQQGCDFLPKLSPFEWTNPHPCNPEPDELENIFDLMNSLWCNIGALMQQGSDLAPKAISTRMVAGIWWFFTLIMISSYTANLAAFLTAANMESPIKGAEDLARQTKIKYGTVKGGSTQNFFRTSQSEVYKKMWTFMESAEPSVFANNNDEGVGRVRRGDYAFFMESTVIEYRIARDCDLTQIGGPLDSKGYGIATPKNSPHRSRINKAVLSLQDEGILLSLKRRWWEEKGLEKKCPEDLPESMELGIANVGGVFVLLVVGCGAAIFIGGLEFIWNVRKNVADKELFGSEIKKELKFALSFGVSTKPVPKDNDNDLEPLGIEPVEPEGGLEIPGFNRYPSTHF